MVAVYLKYLNHENADLRFDSLALLGLVTETREHIPVYRKCLSDNDPRIRALALKDLAKLRGDDLLALKEEIEAMLSDPDMKVKKAALNILKKL